MYPDTLRSGHGRFGDVTPVTIITKYRLMYVRSGRRVGLCRERFVFIIYRINVTGILGETIEEIGQVYLR